MRLTAYRGATLDRRCNPGARVKRKLLKFLNWNHATHQSPDNFPQFSKKPAKGHSETLLGGPRLLVQRRKPHIIGVRRGRPPPVDGIVRDSLTTTCLLMRWRRS